MSSAEKSLPPPASAVLSDAANVLLALSNDRRLAIVNAVVAAGGGPGPVRLAHLAALLDLDIKTLSKEVVRLVEAGVLRRENDALSAELSSLSGLADSVAELTALCRAIPPESPLRRHLSRGRITDLPKRPEDLRAIAVVLADLLPEDRMLAEVEVNELLRQAGDDVASLRRLLVDFELVDRSGSAQYRRRVQATAEERG